MNSYEIRTPYQRDVDKFPYSLPFRRLARITQVISDDDSGIPHNRMTHSMKVAQVGHRLALSLRSDPQSEAGIAAAGGLEPDVVHAAGLAHDIGHPPFGHTGEAVLDRLAVKANLDGFEGNAQTFRVLSKLTRHFAADSASSTFGMNLTDRTLAASVKYPWLRDEATNSVRHTKWGVYPEDEDHFNDRVRPFIKNASKTLEAQVMDWADDITYAVHDIEDFYTGGQIPLHRLKQVYNPATGEHQSVNPYDDEFARFWQYASTRLKGKLRISAEAAERVFRAQAAHFPEAPFEEETATVRARVGRWASDVITQATEACVVDDDGALRVSDEMHAIVVVMKQLTWYYVIERPAMALAQHGQARVLRVVAKVLVKMILAATNPHRASGDSPISADERLANRRSLPAALLEIAKGNGLLALEAPANSETESGKAFQKRLKDHARDRRRIATRSVIDYLSLQTEATVYEHYDLSQHGRA